MDDAFLQVGDLETNGILRIQRTNLDVTGKIHGNGTLEAWDSTLLARGCLCIGPHASLVLDNVRLEARQGDIEGSLDMEGGTFSIVGTGLAKVTGSGQVLARNATLSLEQPMTLERASEAQFVETNVEPSQIRGDGTAKFFRIARLSARTATGEPTDVNATLQSMLEGYTLNVSISDGEAVVDLLLVTYEQQSLVTFDPYFFSASACSANIISRATLSGEIVCAPTGPLHR